MTIQSIDVFLSRFGTSLLFHVQMELLLLVPHTDASQGRSSGLIVPPLEEFFIVCCNSYGQGYGISNIAEVDDFLELSCFFDDPTDAGSLISGSSVFSKSCLNIWKFMVHVLLKPCLKNFEHYFASMCCCCCCCCC